MGWLMNALYDKENDKSQGYTAKDSYSVGDTNRTIAELEARRADRLRGPLAEMQAAEANAMQQLRLQAEAEAVYNPQSVGYRETQRGYAPTYSDQDQIEMNRRGDEMRAQQRYNDEMGASYSGGATQAPAPLAPANAYPNGGEFMPHVGNAWYQADEPLLPWNRKDWDATRAGMADKAVKWYNK